MLAAWSFASVFLVGYNCVFHWLYMCMVCLFVVLCCCSYVYGLTWMFDNGFVLAVFASSTVHV